MYVQNIWEYNEFLMYKTYVYMYSRPMCMLVFIQETSTSFHQFAMLYVSLSDVVIYPADSYMQLTCAQSCDTNAST